MNNIPSFVPRSARNRLSNISISILNSYRPFESGAVFANNYTQANEAIYLAV